MEIVKKLAFLLCLSCALAYAQQQQPACPRLALGADVSFLPQAEHDGTVFTDAGKAAPGLQILRGHGYGWVRLRLFNDPKTLPNDLAYTLAEAKQAKALGYGLLLDFHYSDDWADPSHQTTPVSWQKLKHPQLVQAVYTYTRDTIATFREAGVLPDMVQIGNEITAGILWPDGKLPDNWDHFTELLSAGIRGVNDGSGAGRKPKIMLHIDKGGDQQATQWFFSHILAAHVPFDVIGQSYYPWWEGSLADLKANLDFMARQYHKPIILAEVAYSWRPDNYLKKKGPYPETPEGQKQFLDALVPAVLATPFGLGKGIFWWEPAVRGPLARRGLFDDNGKALPALDEFDACMVPAEKEDTMNRFFPRWAAALALVATAFTHAQNVMTIDATAPATRPEPVPAHLGTARNPAGRVIGVNSQYLTLNGKPWLPVMGEFHFSRYPAAQWEQEILKMKAAGVDIVSTYVIWIHHEQHQGVFDWTGQRDLRLFTQLCARHGMYVYPRIGPWAHAEVRNGGLPDWVLKNSPTRQNDPMYLKEVDTFYKQIALQLHGLLWKDGGPVIGLQVENEYRARGTGKGPDHIRTLKKMAVADGLDVPLYTVTGWDGAAIPLDEALPVFGGYPDAPWDGSPKPLPGNEVFAFRFNNRSAGGMGAIGGGSQSNAASYSGTPFLTAEVGDGTEDTYFRRPVISPADVAVIPTVMLGSGVNLLGYYMFHGGRNPDGGDITLQESQATGYPTDVPVKSYDFQAPLGEFGQQRESLLKLKLVHYFLSDFGPLLAPMRPHAPNRVPTGPKDVSLPRLSARTSGNAGFVFLSNHVRGLDNPAREGFQIQLKLPQGNVAIPATPITLPPDSYGIWPVNLQMNGTLLRYSTAQLFKKVQFNGQTYYFFFAIPGVAPEFCFQGSPAIDTGTSSQPQRDATSLRLTAPAGTLTDWKLPNSVHLVVLPESEAEQIWRVDDPHLLVFTPAAFFSDASTWTLQSLGNPHLALGVFGTTSAPSASSLKPLPMDLKSLFRHYQADLPAATLTPVVTQQTEPSPRGPVRFGPSLPWRKNPLPLAPDDADFTHAARWSVQIPALPTDGSVDDAFLTIRYEGDSARLSQAGHLVDDNFWNSIPWSIGLREVDPAWRAGLAYELRILPLAPDSTLYLEGPGQPKPGQATLTNVTLVPQYQLILTAPPNGK